MKHLNEEDGKKSPKEIDLCWLILQTGAPEDLAMKNCERSGRATSVQHGAYERISREAKKRLLSRKEKERPKLEIWTWRKNAKYQFEVITWWPNVQFALVDCVIDHV